jgi:hypothetical protein
MARVDVGFWVILKQRHASRLLVHDRYDVTWHGNRGDASRIDASARADTSHKSRYQHSTWQAQLSMSSLRHRPIYMPFVEREYTVACLGELLSLSFSAVPHLAFPSSPYCCSSLSLLELLIFPNSSSRISPLRTGIHLIILLLLCPCTPTQP